MKLSLNKGDLLQYTSKQLNYFFPDNNVVDLSQIEASVDMAINRLDYCYKHVVYERYFKDGETIFNHLYADHYLMYIWFLSNSIWKNNGDLSIASKLYYLNKAMHGFDCMYDTKLPDIFLVFHGVGTMLGKATYNDFFVVLQGCTVGSQKGSYPVFGKGVALAANSSVIGNSTLGNRVTVSAKTLIFSNDISDDMVAFVDATTGKLEIKKAKNVYAQQFFNVDLNKL